MKAIRVAVYAADLNVERQKKLWEIPTMKANVLDEKRRLVMPPELPAHSAVTIQQLDETTWLVKRRLPEGKFKMVAIPLVSKLPIDPEWEKTEAKLAKHATRRLPHPED